MPGKPLLAINAKAGDYLLVRVPDDIHPTHLLYKGEKVPLYPLNHTFNGMHEYRTPTLNDGQLTGSRVDADLVVYDGEGVRLPIDAVLDRNGEKTVLVAKNGHAEALPITVTAAGEQGVVVVGKELAGLPVILAKPDILLNLLSGVAIKVRSEK